MCEPNIQELLIHPVENYMRLAEVYAWALASSNFGIKKDPYSSVEKLQNIPDERYELMIKSLVVNLWVLGENYREYLKFNADRQCLEYRDRAIRKMILAS
jgi:hypothetical protein